MKVVCRWKLALILWNILISLTPLFGNCQHKLWCKMLYFYNVLALSSFHTFGRHLLNSALSRSGFLLGPGDTKAIATGSLPPESPRASGEGRRIDSGRTACCWGWGGAVPWNCRGDDGPWVVMRNLLEGSKQWERAGAGQRNDFCPM